MNYKVSVIVPIYKVEQYLHRCVDSIIKQTYKNLEIILVDDGSPDKCGNICDEYATKDSRIKSIHKKNGGLSDARNYGMNYATGDFVLFVDSDDWLELEMIEVMINTAQEYNADIVQSSFYYAYEDYLLLDDRYYKEDDAPVILNKNELMKALVINERVKNFAWGKLYKIDLVKNIPFKKGVLYEDVFWAHNVMDKVETYVILHTPMCYYLQRNDSIVYNYTLKNLDIIKGLKERHTFIEEHYNELIPESYKIIFNTCLCHYNLLNKNKDLNKFYKNDIKMYIQENYEKMKTAFKGDNEVLIRLKLFNKSYQIYKIYDLSDKILRKLGVKTQYKSLKKVGYKNE